MHSILPVNLHQSISVTWVFECLSDVLTKVIPISETLLQCRTTLLIAEIGFLTL